MFDNKTIVAVIPARGGSKGIPKKNIKILRGHPLIAYTISAARKSRYVDAVIVSTDSEEIANVARRYGAEVPFVRPQGLASDTSKSIDVLVHARDVLVNMGRDYDVIVLMQPTSPLRSADEVDGAIEAFFSHGMMGTASVQLTSDNPILTRRLDEFGVLHPIIPISSTVRRQEMPPFYHVNGAIYVNDAHKINDHTSLNDNPISYVMNKDRSLDIDNIEDFLRAETILAKLDDPEPLEY
ncbi:MAG: acylneuraminate cytidylyltransferase family protein [Coriobacteriia bacterium]|nr:acylneuraminate cytidylyltransferase family protein [Coriobacteriia bacterium]